MKKILVAILAISVLAFFIVFSSVAQASIFDMIRAWVTINPLLVDVSAPAEVEINKVFKIEAKIINKGEEKIEKAKGEIFLPSGLILLKKDPVQEIGIIPPKKEKKISWSVKGETIGSYIISVSVSGELRGYGISAEDNTNVEVKESLRGVRPREWFQNFLDFVRERFRF